MIVSGILVQTLGLISLFYVNHLKELYAVVFFFGMGQGMSLLLMFYAQELVLEQHRRKMIGAVGSLEGFIVVAFVMYSRHVSSHWEPWFASSVIFSAITIVFMFPLPESP